MCLLLCDLPFLAVYSTGSSSVCMLDGLSGAVICEWGAMLADPHIVRCYDVAYITVTQSTSSTTCGPPRNGTGNAVATDSFYG
jgi:hypothetical protein